MALVENSAQLSQPSRDNCISWSIFKLAGAAEESWCRLDAHNQLPKVVLGVTFTDAVELLRSQTQAAAALTPSVTKIRNSSARNELIHKISKGVIILPWREILKRCDTTPNNCNGTSRKSKRWSGLRSNA